MHNTKHVQSSGNVSDLYSGDAQFKSRAEHDYSSYIFSEVSNHIMTTSFNILSNPLFTNHYPIQCYTELLKASLNKP